MGKKRDKPLGIIKPMKYLLTLLLSCTLFLIQAQSVAWQRCQNLGKGMNLSWLETWWNGTAEYAYSDYLDLTQLSDRKADLALMKELGITTIRLPVCFEVWAHNAPPYTIDHPEYFQAIDSLILWANQYDQKVIIDYQHGTLNDCNLVYDTARLKAIWRQIAAHFQQTDPEQVFLELFNEPHDISAPNWQKVAQELLDEIRPLVPEHSIILGGVDYNGIKGLRLLEPLTDPNIIYTFHFYEPFIFTHQGAEWVGEPVTTTDIPFPFNESKMPPMNPRAKGTFGEYRYNVYHHEGQITYLRFYLEAVKAWSLEHQLPIFCGEWGAHYLADEESRCRHAAAVIQYFQELDIPYCYWEWDRNFSFFDQQSPSINNLPSCMEAAWFVQIPELNAITISPTSVLMPNPISDQLLLVFPNPDQYDRVEIYTLDGRIMGRYFLGGTSMTKMVSDWPAGTYILHFYDMEGNNLHTKKLLKL